jgi:hypothetical protein
LLEVSHSINFFECILREIMLDTLESWKQFFTALAIVKDENRVRCFNFGADIDVTSD